MRPYEFLQDLVKIAFGQQKNGRSHGGNSKRFDACTSDFTVMWYLGKLVNTLTFNGQLGCLTKQCLFGNCSYVDFFERY